ncbi:MAG: undecaprenyl-diphosphate phosphatase [Bacteroidota bacterium]
MSWWQAALLGLLQGLTEFLPVSSSGHLVLGQYVLGIDAEAAGDVTFEVFVHFGTTMSILTVYWSRVVEIIKQTFSALGNPSEIGERFRQPTEFRIAVLILLSMIPTAIVYVTFKDQLEQAFSDPRLVCGALLFTGLLLLLTRLRPNPDGRLTMPKALVVGLAQAMALIPGISRSGSTICTALYQNVNQEQAANFSFLMVLPVIVGATLLKTLEMFELGGPTMGVLPLVIGAGVAYVSGVWAIRVMIDLVKKGSLQYFAYYCFLIGSLGLILI